MVIDLAGWTNGVQNSQMGGHTSGGSRVEIMAVLVYQRASARRGEMIAVCVGDIVVAIRILKMIEAGSRRRNQPALPPVVFAALTQPDRAGARPWLHLLDDEVRPRVMRSDEPELVVWSSLWLKRSDAVVRFDLPPSGDGTDLRWTLLVEEPAPGDALLGHLRNRLNQLINADLRYSFGQ
ncbi:hypothetical protein [Lapillicoccus sp.]|uniref:hypothetical protein n=1 Tax=Lapillicoccus sp. TaxID=1909287 RepID=UPI003983B910